MNEFLIVATAHLLAVMSPGPDLSVVSKIAVSNGRREGVKASIGVALGIAVHISLSLIGLAAILKVNKGLFELMQVAGASYLLWIGYHALVGGYRRKTSGSKEATSEAFKSVATPKDSFKQGLITNVTNPKATLFFLTLFTQVVSANTSGLIKTLYGVEMIFATFVWFVFVSYGLNTKPIKKFVTNNMWIVDIFFGIVLLAIGGIVLIEVFSK